jgi:membrane protease YdiL (CAAX protease family)
MNQTNVTSISTMRSYLLAVLALVYLIVRLGFTQQLEAFGLYTPYIFEVICVAISFALVGAPSLSFFKLQKAAAWGMVAALFAGFASFKGAGGLGIQIPFDLSGTETIFFLLLVAPVLEELIFRFMLWQPIRNLVGCRLVALIATSVLFSYAHFHALWSVPVEIHPFIYYQTAYTLVLGLACGYYVYRYSSVTSAVFVHFGFNLGFWLGSLG